jgi:4-diphosphocytidyl-2-C-methyl-D-erythritol kinase
MIKKAYAKINLTIDVLNKRPDNYHNVKMVMQQIALHDLISVDLGGEGIVISSNCEKVPCNEKNIAYKAAKIMLEKANYQKGVKIHIEKNIPVCAGLAGGSTDGAAVICALNELLELNLDKKELMKIGSNLGADVPFCIMGGTALAENTGTELSPLPPFKPCCILLVKPPIDVSTPWVYQNLKLDGCYHPDVDLFIKHLKNKEFDKALIQMGNVLETVTANEYPIINNIKEKMISLGAKYSMMSGSGPTVFGIFESEDIAKEAEKNFKNEFDEVIISQIV